MQSCLHLNGAPLTAPCLVFYVYNTLSGFHTPAGSARGLVASIHTSMSMIMAKTGLADNQFKQGEKYLAHITLVRWTSLPTIGANEAGLAIQFKLCVLCTAPTKGDPIFCGREAVVYIYVTTNPTIPTEHCISDSARTFLDNLGIMWPLVPDRDLPIYPRNNTIICKFGDPDMIGGYQSIVEWELATDNVAQDLVTKSIATGTRPNPIVGLRFPRPLIVTKGRVRKELINLHDWHALKLLYNRAQYGPDSFYNAEELMHDAYTNADRHIPRSTKATTEQLIHRLQHSIGDLNLELKSYGAGNYALLDLTNNPSKTSTQALKQNKAKNHK